MRPPAISLGAGDVALLASDIHAGDHDPRLLDLLGSEIERAIDDEPGISSGTLWLFLLGDVFEAWIGDDDDDATALAALAWLERLRRRSSRPLRALVMRGNRDFLLGAPLPDRAPGFVARAGMSVFDDPILLDAFGVRTVLCHGDSLCTDDTDYQAFRRLVRSPDWQQAFLARPLVERRELARAMRAQSRAAMANSRDADAGSIGDVDPKAVREVLLDSGARRLIHGHTHRPACHRIQIDGRACERWVLPDWDADGLRGGLLRIGTDGIRRLGPWPSDAPDECRDDLRQAPAASRPPSD
ncbi:MAG: UDP-2,3-diacylglucosamine diphosphatase [Burkholderiaceae bacterium]|nr:UDP-2,3-diacylglucosamine diphosphatase [Burkholderiaceae bacterium]